MKLVYMKILCVTLRFQPKYSVSDELEPVT